MKTALRPPSQNYARLKTPSSRNVKFSVPQIHILMKPSPVFIASVVTSRNRNRRSTILMNVLPALNKNWNGSSAKPHLRLKNSNRMKPDWVVLFQQTPAGG